MASIGVHALEAQRRLGIALDRWPRRRRAYLDLPENAASPIGIDRPAAGLFMVGRRTSRSKLTAAWGDPHPRDAIQGFGEYTEQPWTC